ncbi:MAG: hypothetical protein U0354_11295 [Candidatus Sericytochromatia bacterium]
MRFYIDLPPEYNPIEMIYTKIKKNKTKNLHELKNSITKAYQTITNQDVIRWFNHCWYEC